jgi:hypothetical protein
MKSNTPLILECRNCAGDASCAVGVEAGELHGEAVLMLIQRLGVHADPTILR